MKKIGREVLFLRVKPGNPRNGEGAFLRLNDGRIMHFYTKYDGNRWDDHCLADIVAIFSNDEGETWGNERVIVSKAGKYGNNGFFLLLCLRQRWRRWTKSMELPLEQMII